MYAGGLFIFHGVGQGLFYSGAIMLPGEKPFHFVYDCGSLKQTLIEMKVEEYKRKILRNNHLDMLIISHLHADHVSGIDKLLSNPGANYVFLPYLLPMERLVLALMYPEMPEWYYRFLRDPINFLIEKGAGTVILFGSEGGEEEGIGGGERGGPPPNPEEFSLPEDVERERLILNFNRDTILEARLQKLEGADYSPFIQADRLKIVKNQGYVVSLGLWLFTFFNFKLKSNALDRFKICVQQHLNAQIDAQAIKTCIADNNCRKSLRKCYEKIQKDLGNDFNNTSLVVNHLPIGHYQAVFCMNYPWWWEEWMCEWFWWCEERCPWRHFSRNRFGQWLTGDIDLNYKTNEIRVYFWNQLPATFLIQVPHHGAKKNLNKSFLNTKIRAPIIWVTSAGIRNKYRHPHSTTLSYIYRRVKREGGIWAWANEYHDVILCSCVRWFK